MTQKEKLLERFLSLPVDFTFNEPEKLLLGFGYIRYNKGKTSGSRVIYRNSDNRPIMLHKPHPGNIVKMYALKQVFNELAYAGFINNIDSEEEKEIKE